jgi:hypothetical protein
MFLAALAMATATLAGSAVASVDLTTVYSAKIAKAVFARQYNTVWNYIAPAYRAAVKKSAWRHCEAALVRSTGSLRISRISVANSRDLHSTLPVFGQVALVDVSIQFLYTLPGQKKVQAGVLSAYWVKMKGKWYAVWLPTQYSAYKAGKCSSTSLY